MNDIEQIMKNVNGSMSIEGMPLTDDDMECMRKCLNGILSFDEAVAAIVSEYTVGRAV